MFGISKKTDFPESIKYKIVDFINHFENVTFVLEGFVKSCYASKGEDNPKLKFTYLVRSCKELKSNIDDIFSSMDEDLRYSAHNAELEFIRNGLSSIISFEYSAQNGLILGKNVREIWNSMQDSKNKLKRKINV